MFRSICVLISLFGWDGVTVLATEDKATLMTGNFQAGKIGIHATWNNGRVNKIDEGGQGEREGVEVGMVMIQVNGQEYSEKLLDQAIDGDGDYQVTFKKFPPLPGTKKEDDTPPKPDFVYATELTADTFQEQVYKVTNWTGMGQITNPPYYPVVLFHVSWCKHCKHALPEFEKAAQIVDEANQKGQLRHLSAIPKFFVIECDVIPEHKAICELYTGTNYPVCKLFRDQRAVHFNRPRMAQTYAWWASHVARRPLSELREEDVSEVEKQRGPLYVLNADSSDQTSIQTWAEVALDWIEEHHFVHVRPDSAAASKLKLPPPPSVGVVGAGMDPLAFDGEFVHDQLAEWANINQFEPVTDLDGYNAHTLKKSGLVVVVLTYKKDSDDGLKKQFDFIAKQMRTGRQFLFAAIDVEKEEHVGFLEHAFPLTSPKLSPSPRVFAFSGEGTYWEDPSFQDPSTISRETLEALLSNAEALQDGSKASAFKEKRKRVVRFAMTSNKNLAITIGGPILVLGLLWLCFKAMCASDAEPDKAEKAEKAD